MDRTVAASDKRKLTILSRAGHSANDMYWFVLPVVLPIVLRDYGFSYTEAGGFLTSFLCVLAVVSFFVGKLADHLPRVVLLSGGFFFASGFLLASGFLPGFTLFMVFLLLAAAGVASYHPVMYAVISEATTTRTGKMFATFERFGALGVLVLLFVHGLLIDYIGWKGVVFIACVPGFVMGALLYINKRILEYQDVAGCSGTHGDEKRAAASVTEPADDDRNKQINGRRSSGAGIRNTVLGILILFFCSVVLRTLTATAVINFMPTYLAETTGFGVSFSSFMSAFVFVGAIGASFFVGHLADRFGPIRSLVTTSILAGVFLLSATYVTQPWMLPVALIILGGTISGAIPLQNMILSTFSGNGRKGSAFGMLMGIMTVANSLGPLFLGMIADRIGLTITFRMAAVPVLLSAILVVVVGRTPVLRFSQAAEAHAGTSE